MKPPFHFAIFAIPAMALVYSARVSSTPAHLAGPRPHAFPASQAGAGTPAETTNFRLFRITREQTRISDAVTALCDALLATAADLSIEEKTWRFDV